MLVFVFLVMMYLLSKQVPIARLTQIDKHVIRILQQSLHNPQLDQIQLSEQS